MNKSQIIDLITSPIADDYFPKQFIMESKAFKELDVTEAYLPKEEHILTLKKEALPPQWHSWFDTYCQLINADEFPLLWPFEQSMIAFDFKDELDDFDAKNNYFSLGSDPSGDWYVVSALDDATVRLCDQHDYGLYDGWKNPNHLLAWALRYALADENSITKAEILARWEQQAEKVEEDTLQRIVDDLN